MTRGERDAGNLPAIKRTGNGPACERTPAFSVPALLRSSMMLDKLKEA